MCNIPKVDFMKRIVSKNMIPSMLFAKYDISDLLSTHHPVKHSYKNIERHNKELRDKCINFLGIK